MVDDNFPNVIQAELVFFEFVFFDVVFYALVFWGTGSDTPVCDTPSCWCSLVDEVGVREIDGRSQLRLSFLQRSQAVILGRPAATLRRRPLTRQSSLVSVQDEQLAQWIYHHQVLRHHRQDLSEGIYGSG